MHGRGARTVIEPADVARRYSGSRPGFELVHYQEVGLPYYRLVVDSLTQQRKAVGPIDEFLLRAVNEGLDTLDDVSGVLGLDRSLIDRSVVRLNQLDHLDYRVEGDRRVLKITPLGTRALGGWMELAPERQELMVGFDRLTWRVTGRHFRSLMRPKDARSAGLLELPPRRTKRISPSDLDLDDVHSALAELARSSLREVDLLSVLDVGNYRMMLPAVALVFSATSGKDQQVAFAVDGRLSETHELGFAEIDGPSRSGLVVEEAAAAAEIPELPDDVRRRRADRDAVAQLSARVAQAASEVDRARTATATASTADAADDLPDARSQEEQSEAEYVAASVELARLPIRAIQTYEHRALLADALASAKERLLVISPWIRGDVVDDRFIGELRACARRRVEIHIGWGIARSSAEEEGRSEPVEKLRKLAREFDNMTIRHLGSTHAKVLMWDSQLVVTSFNWLSFRADKRRGFRQEEGTLISDPTYVDQEYKKYRDQIIADRSD